MAFNLIKPATPMPGSGEIRIRTVKSKHGYKLMLSVPGTCMAKAKWFDPPAALLVEIGDGTDAGKLRLIEEDKDQKGQGIKVTVMKHTCLLRLPVQDWMPQMAFDPHKVEAAYSDRQMILTLPQWAWNKDRQRAIEVARKQDRADSAKRLTHKAGDES